MSWVTLLLAIHILSATAFFGGILARQLVRAQAASASDVITFAALSNAAGRVEDLMVIPGNLLTIVSGVTLAVLVDAPLFGFLAGRSENWLLVTNLLLVAGMLEVPLFFLPRGKRFDDVVKDALARNELTPELRAAIDDPALHIAHRIEIAALILIVLLMVLKPF